MTKFCCLCGKELSHQIPSLCSELYSILTSMTELISFASRLASSSMSLPSFKVFSICRLPLSIASFFFYSIQRKRYYTSIWVKPISTVGSYFPRAVWTTGSLTKYIMTVWPDDNDVTYPLNPLKNSSTSSIYRSFLFPIWESHPGKEK